MSTPSQQATAKFRHMRDGDDARDLAFDYDSDAEAQYADYREFCAEMGVEPLPFKGAPARPIPGGLALGNPIKRMDR